MVAGLDLPLDDLVRANKRSSRGRGARASGPGPVRHFAPSRYTFRRPAPYSSGEGVYSRIPQGTLEVEIGTKLFISNIDYGVSDEDIHELFSAIGDLKWFGVHFDRSGRSEGTAEVVFSRRVDAEAAVKRFNNVKLDGKPMKVEIVGSNILKPVKGAAGTMIRDISVFPWRDCRISEPRGLSQGCGPVVQACGRRRGRRRGRARRDRVSAEDLDADLEKYFSEATRIC